MRTLIITLSLIAAVVAVCVFLFGHMYGPGEQTQYDKAMDLISSWQGNGPNREEAREIALKMLKDNPQSARAYTILGRVTWWMGYHNDSAIESAKVMEAQEYYHKALEADPEFRDAIYYLGVAHMTAGEYDQALELADQLLEKHPDWPWSYYLPIKVDNKQKNYERVIEACLDLQKRFPDDKYTVGFTDGHLVNAYKGLGMLDEADALHQKFVKANPRRAWTLGNYAAFLCDYKKDYDKAIEYAQKALAIMDYEVGRNILADSAFHKSQELLKQNKMEEAETYCLMAVENQPNFTQALAELALINYVLAKQNNDLERMKKAQLAAHRAQLSGPIDKKWAVIMMQIAIDLTKMENEAKKNQETTD